VLPFTKVPNNEFPPAVTVPFILPVPPAPTVTVIADPEETDNPVSVKYPPAPPPPNDPPPPPATTRYSTVGGATSGGSIATPNPIIKPGVKIIYFILKKLLNLNWSKCIFYIRLQ
jgi:hypothetical protein